MNALRLPKFPVCALGLLAMAVAPAARSATTSLLEGFEPGGRFGWSVTDAGDLNGDGLPDLAVGAPLDDTGGAERGRVFVWFGGGSLALAPDRVLQGERGGDRFGWCVRGVGDVNGDGRDDLAVGAPWAIGAAGSTGEVYLYFGGATDFDTNVDRTLSGEVAGDLFGWSIAGRVDVYSTSARDVIVGAPGWGNDQGAVYVFAGGSTIQQSPNLRWTGVDGKDFFGFSVGEVPDFRGNGTAAVVVGAPGALGLNGTIDAPDGIGRAYLYFKDATSAAATFADSRGSAGNEFGWAVSELGDVNGDGRTDLAVGGPGYLGDRGTTSVFLGVATLPANPSPARTLDGATGGDRFGAAITEIGNFDGGARDWAVGAPLRDEGASDAGAVYVFSGVPTSLASGTKFGPVNRSRTATALDLWGTSLSAAGGDLDGDGRDDLLVGSPDANAQNAAVVGNLGIVGSGSGVVSAPVVRARFDRSSAGLFVAEFAGLEAVQSARLDDGAGRVLASLDAGLTVVVGGLRAEIDATAIEGLTRVHLRWVDAYGAREQGFDLPPQGGRALRLIGAAPNPFNPSTRVRFELPARVPYRLRVLDPRGRVVRELAGGEAGPGAMEVRFDGLDDAGRPLASGSYRLLLESGGQRRSAALTLVQ